MTLPETTTKEDFLQKTEQIVIRDQRNAAMDREAARIAEVALANQIIAALTKQLTDAQVKIEQLEKNKVP